MRQGHRLLAQLQIERPCSESWDAMPGDERRRSCARCQNDVHDLSVLTADEAEALLQKDLASLCVRYAVRRDGSVITRPSSPLTTGPSRVARAAGSAAILAAVACSTPDQRAQSPLGPTSDSRPVHSPADERGDGSSVSRPVRDDIAALQRAKAEVEATYRQLRENEQENMYKMGGPRPTPVPPDSSLGRILTKWREHSARLSRCCRAIQDALPAVRPFLVRLSWRKGRVGIAASASIAEQRNGCIEAVTKRWGFPRFVDDGEAELPLRCPPSTRPSEPSSSGPCDPDDATCGL